MFRYIGISAHRNGLPLFHAGWLFTQDAYCKSVYYMGAYSSMGVLKCMMHRKPLRYVRKHERHEQTHD